MGRVRYITLGYVLTNAADVVSVLTDEADACIMCITLGYSLTDGAGGVFLGWVVRSLHDTIQSLLSVCLARFAHASVRVFVVFGRFVGFNLVRHCNWNDGSN